MSYESPDEKIEKLQSALIETFGLMRQAAHGQNLLRNALIQTQSAIINTETVNLTLFRLLFDMPGVPEAVRVQFGKLIGDTQKKYDESKAALEKAFKDVPEMVLPEDLFGPR